MPTIGPIIRKPISSARKVAVLRLAWRLRTLTGRNIAFSSRTSSATPWPTSAIDRRGRCVIHPTLISGWNKDFAKRGCYGADEFGMNPVCAMLQALSGGLFLGELLATSCRAEFSFNWFCDDEGPDSDQDLDG